MRGGINAPLATKKQKQKPHQCLTPTKQAAFTIRIKQISNQVSSLAFQRESIFAPARIALANSKRNKNPRNVLATLVQKDYTSLHLSLSHSPDPQKFH